MGFLEFKTIMNIECYAKVGLLPGSASKGVYFKIYEISSSEEAYPCYQTFLEELKNQHPDDFVTGIGWKISELESN